MGKRTMTLDGGAATHAAFDDWWKKEGDAMWRDHNVSTHDLARLAFWDATLWAKPEYSKKSEEE